jgi:hypothetical protein
MHSEREITCSAWTSARRSSPAAATPMKEWVWGYLTAFNRYGPQPDGNVVANTPADEIWGVLDAYCATDPSPRLDRRSAFCC